MAGNFAELHDELRSVAGELLAKERATGSEVTWPLLAQAGWTGLEIPDELDGAGASFAEVAVVLQEMGRAATNSAYLGGAVLSVGTLIKLQPNKIRDELLAGIAAGSIRTAVALSADHETASASAPFTIAETAAGWLLTGRSEFVPDTPGADQLFVLADDPNGTPVMVVVPSGALTVAAQPVLDETRRLASVTAVAVEIEESSVLRFDGDPQACVRGLTERAAVAVACDSLGLAEAMLSATVSYTGIRQQFGRSIGSFQAVKHMCADMLVQISVARQLVGAAVDAVAEGGDTTTAVKASMAKAYACDTAVAVVGTAMQLHGGIGYTWESGVHVYLKRAALNRSLFGSPAAHRKQLAQRYL